MKKRGYLTALAPVALAAFSLSGSPAHADCFTAATGGNALVVDPNAMKDTDPGFLVAQANSDMISDVFNQLLCPYPLNPSTTLSDQEINFLSISGIKIAVGPTATPGAVTFIRKGDFNRLTLNPFWTRNQNATAVKLLMDAVMNDIDKGGDGNGTYQVKSAVKPELSISQK